MGELVVSEGFVLGPSVRHRWPMYIVGTPEEIIRDYESVSEDDLPYVKIELSNEHKIALLRLLCE